MKKQNLLTLTLALCSSCIFADKPTAKGYYITKDKDSIPCTFTINTKLLSKEPSDDDMQRSVKFVDKKGNEGKVKPGDTFEYGFTYLNKKYKYVSIPLSWQPFKTQIFMRVEVDGYCKLLITINGETATPAVDFTITMC